LARVVAYLQLGEPDDLQPWVSDVTTRHPTCRVITFGHTHNPVIARFGEKWFFNTGTWIPIVETSSADVRHDRTYTVLRVRRENGAPTKGPLLRWNDDAKRLEPMDLIRRR